MDEDLKYIREDPSKNVEQSQTRFNKKRVFVSLGVAIVLILGIFYYEFISSPTDFPKETLVIVEKGETLSNFANTLLEKHIIKSRFFFKVFVVLFNGRNGLVAGDYMLDSRKNLIVLSWRFANGKYNLENLKITIPEGKNNQEIAKLFDEKFYNFSAIEFLTLASTSEGYLFPDTYIFTPSTTAEEVFRVLHYTFNKKIETIISEIETFKKSSFAKLKEITPQDIITMASILEEEGRTMETRRTIAGILWKRLSLGMALQVDASIVYATGKKDGSYLVPEDFKIVSLYNTYLNRGFTPTPISNPGLESIKATITPISSKYFYYITNKEGEFYPAVTYEEHLTNQEKYLK